MITKATPQTHISPQRAASKNYNGIDLVKFLCSILVFFIHVTLFQDESTHLQEVTNFAMRHTVARLAVPFYFTCSGFFLFRKMPLHDSDVRIIQQYCFKILRLFAIWSILLVIGGNYHLWYLSATIVAILFLTLLLRARISMRCLYFIAVMLYAIGLLGDTYHVFAAPLADYGPVKLLIKGYTYFFPRTRNGIFMGFIFVLTGASFAQSKVLLSPKKSLLGLILSVVLLLAEVFTLRHCDVPPGNMYILLLPAVYFLFSFAVQWELPDRPVYKRLRAASLWFYFIHLFVDFNVQTAARAFNKYLGFQILPYRFILSLCATVILSFGLEALSRRDKFKWLNQLI